MTRNNYFIFACSLLLMLAFIHINEYRYISDDLWFSRVSLSETDHLKWVISRYYNWSSRTPIEYALISIINHFDTWSLLNSIFFAVYITSTCYLVSLVTKTNMNHTTLPILAILLYCMPQNILHDGAIWITGSFNYLWPTALAFLSYAMTIKLIANDNVKVLHQLVLSITTMLSTFNEQVAIVNLFFSLSMMLYCAANKSSLKIPLTMLVSVLLVLIYIATCPGNKVRYDSEVLKWFKDYNDIGFVKKSLLGLNLYTDALLSHKSLVPAIMAFSISLIVKKNLRAIPVLAGFILLIVAFLYGQPDTIAKTRFTSDSITSMISFRRLAYGFIITMLMLVPLLLTFRNTMLNFILMALLLSSIASASMLGFSPTVYASGDRILFVSYLLFSLITALCIAYRISKYEFNLKVK